MKYVKTLLTVGVLVSTLAFASETFAATPTNNTNKVTTPPMPVVKAPVVVAVPSTVKTPVVVTPATPATSANQWALSLAGGGSTQLSSAKESGTGEIGIGKTFVLGCPAEAGIRQDVGYASPSWNGSTKFYSDWSVWTWKRLEIDLGANTGISYGGEGSPMTYDIAPEAVTRYYLDPTKKINAFGRVEYPFQLNDKFKSEDTLPVKVGFEVRFN